jgi:hypothetical protein
LHIRYAQMTVVYLIAADNSCGLKTG